ncbi:MAG: hypothetical protein AAF581_12615 [Planctomycetota bacterium]
MLDVALGSGHWLLAQVEPRHFVAIFGILILIWVVFRIGSKRRQRRSSGEAAPDRATASADPVAVHRAGEDLSEVLVQLQEVSREVEARLDTRIRYARRLLDQADAVTERLETMLGNAKELGVAPRSGNAPGVAPQAKAAAAYRSPSTPQTSSNSASVNATTSNTAASPASSGAAAEAVPSAESSGAGTDTSKVAPMSPPNARPEVARIEELAATGMDAAAIAREVNLPVGEVDLVMGLRRQANREKSS